MPYGDLVAQRVQRFATYDDLDRHETTIEEREEYEPHLDAGRVVYAGVDYEAILRAGRDRGRRRPVGRRQQRLPVLPAGPASSSSPTRSAPATSVRYHPGETNLRMADVVIINKVDSAEPSAVDAGPAAIAELNPRATVLTARSDLTLVGAADRGQARRRRRGRTDAHPRRDDRTAPASSPRAASGRPSWSIRGPRPSAPSGRCWIAIRPSSRSSRRWATGTPRSSDLEATLNAVDADLVLSATPIDLTRVLSARQADHPGRLRAGRGEWTGAPRHHRADRRR